MSENKFNNQNEVLIDLSKQDKRKPIPIQQNGTPINVPQNVYNSFYQNNGRPIPLNSLQGAGYYPYYPNGNLNTFQGNKINYSEDSWLKRNWHIVIIFILISITVLMMFSSCNSAVMDGLSSKYGPSEELFDTSKCEFFTYKECARHPEKYIGKPIKVLVKISQVLDYSYPIEFKNYGAYGLTDAKVDYDCMFLINDRRPVNSEKILKGDYIIVYGVFTGMEEVKYALRDTTEEIIGIDMFVSDLIKE